MKVSFKLPSVSAPCWLMCQPSLEQLKGLCWLPVVQDSWRETPGCGLGSIWPAREQIPSQCLYETLSS